MRKTIIFILPIVVLFLLGCSRSNLSARLVEVDSLLSAELNDSAYRVIDAINEDELKTSEDRAYYQLLKTRTYILNSKSLTTDNIIDSAITYYQQHSNHERLANSYYYKAGLIYSLKDIDKYVFYLKKAEEFAELTEDNQIKYKIYDAISYANNLNGSYDISLSYAQKSLKIAKDSSRKSWLAYAYYNIGYAYLGQGKVDSAFYYYDKTEPFIKYVQKKDRQIRLNQLTNQVSILELRKNQAETQIAKLEKDKLADIRQLKEQMALAEQEKAEYERQIKEWTGEESAKLRLGIDLYGKIENNEKVQSWGNEQYEAFIAYYDTINHQAFKKMVKGYEKLTLQNTFYLILKDMGKSKDDICSIMSLEKSSLRSIESRLRAKEIRR